MIPKSLSLPLPRWFCSNTTASYGEWKSFPGRCLGKDRTCTLIRKHPGRIERGKYGCSIDLLIELSYTLNASTDYLLLGRNPDRDQDRKQLLQVISQLSDIARNM